MELVESQTVGDPQIVQWRGANGRTRIQKSEIDFGNALQQKSSLRTFPMKNPSTENGRIPGYFLKVISFQFVFYSACNFPANWLLDKHTSTENNC